MKKFLFLFLLFINFIFATDNIEFLKQGDFYYNKRNDMTHTAKALTNINKAIDFYEKALKQKEDEMVYYKLTKAIDFKYNFLVYGDEYRQGKWETLKLLIERIDKFCKNNNCNDSKYIVYSRAILIGRFGELLNIIEAASDGTAGKIRDYAEKLLALDKTFENHAAYIILGRLHYKAPNIVFLLTWPDKNKSREYLEKYLEKETESLTGMYFLADTLWNLGEQQKAKELYNKVLQTKPRKYFYYEDIKAQKEVEEKITQIK